MDNPSISEGEVLEEEAILADLDDQLAKELYPKCQTKLAHFSGLEHIPEHLYCPECLDKAYDYDGKVLFDLE